MAFKSPIAPLESTCVFAHPSILFLTPTRSATVSIEEPDAFSDKEGTLARGIGTASLVSRCPWDAHRIPGRLAGHASTDGPALHKSQDCRFLSAPFGRHRNSRHVGGDGEPWLWVDRYRRVVCDMNDQTLFTYTSHRHRAFTNAIVPGFLVLDHLTAVTSTALASNTPLHADRSFAGNDLRYVFSPRPPISDRARSREPSPSPPTWPCRRSRWGSWERTRGRFSYGGPHRQRP